LFARTKPLGLQRRLWERKDMNKHLFAPVVALMFAVSACSGAPAATEAIEEAQATATQRVEPTDEPTQEPTPTPDYQATADAKAAAEAATMLAIIQPDLDLAGYTADGGEMWFSDAGPIDIVNQTPGTYLYEEVPTDGTIGNFILSTDVVWDSKTGFAGCGIIFRAKDSIDNGEQAIFNAVRLSGFPAWDIELWNFGDFQANLTGKIRPNSAIDNGAGALNHYVLVVDGSAVTVYANGTKLGVTNLKASMTEGLIGLTAWQESGETTCTFTNFMIWGLPS
jgi:hypothetical protein